MQPYRVSILAAGGGTRIGASSSSHKALVRLGDRAVISHIIDLFPEDATIVVAVGFNGHLIRDYLELFYPCRVFIFIDVPHWGKGYGPGYALRACRAHLQGPFYTWSCDTVVGSLPPEICNWAGYKMIDGDLGGYCTLRINDSSAITGFLDKCPDGTGAAWIGAGYVKDFEHFWREMDGNNEFATGELQITKALFALPMKAIEFPDWLDTGNEAGLRRALERFGVNVMQKPQEEVYFNGPSVIKFFNAPGVAAEKARRAVVLGGLVPRVECVRDNFYSSEYVPGIDLTSIENPHEYIIPLLDFLAGNLWRDVILAPDERAAFEEDCMAFYRTKTLERLNLAMERLGVNDTPYSINGCSLPAMSVVLEKVPWEALRQGIPSTFHGDLNFSNVVLTQQGSFALLDQRERFGRFDNTGDRYYDFSKCYQSVLWPHISIRRGRFSISSQMDREISVQLEVPESLQASRRLIESWLKEHGYDVWRVRCIGALSLLNSAPLHNSHIGMHLYFWGYWNLANVLSGC